MPFSSIDNFLKRESAAGMLLVAAAATAMLVANSPLGGLYDDFLALPISVAVGDLVIAKPLILWVNDGLMAWFFFLVGLEIKREVLDGELSSLGTAVLPAVAALGGIVGPALVYAAFNWSDPAAIGGWAIPAATDIAFALGIVALLGSRVPMSLKIFLTALAIIDDLGAIMIIAVLYTDDLSVTALAVAALCIAVLIGLNLRGIRRTDVYIGIGIVLWVAVLKSGVHATLAGVVTALAIPLKPDAKGFSPLTHLEEELHSWVHYLILPVFAFANAGLNFATLAIEDAFSTVSIGIAAGLAVGKQAGVMIAAALCFAFGVARPAGASLLQFYGVSVLTGVGFTMSLFIGDLAFSDLSRIGSVKAGVLVGSLASALLGYLILRAAAPPATKPAAA